MFLVIFNADTEPVVFTPNVYVLFAESVFAVVVKVIVLFVVFLLIVSQDGLFVSTVVHVVLDVTFIIFGVLPSGGNTRVVLLNSRVYSGATYFLIVTEIVLVTELSYVLIVTIALLFDVELFAAAVNLTVVLLGLITVTQL